ncbi:MAG: porin [Cocleimonas sp.]|nr:porin [Cocleimonas sp.]
MKKLLAIAVAAGLAAPMAVMADTTVYGKLKISIGSDKAGGKSVASVKSHASRIGMKGAMPMDNGMSITHKVELGIDDIADNGKGTGTVSARDTWLGLKGNFGEVRVGRHSTPMNLASDALNIMNYGGQGTIEEGGFRVPNAIAYLKGFGPVGFAAAYVPDEDSTKKTDILDTMVNYNSNGIYAAWGHQKAKGSKATDTLSLAYTLPAGHKAGLVFNKANNGNKNTALFGRYKFGKAYVQGELSKRKDVDGSKRVIEAGYGLGKGTSAWFSLGDGDLDNADTSHARIGITSKF